MKIQLVSCDDPRPNSRNISKMLEEIAGLDNYDARDMTDNLLDGSPVDLEITTNTSSAFRALRKHKIDYEIVD